MRYIKIGISIINLLLILTWVVYMFIRVRPIESEQISIHTVQKTPFTDIESIQIIGNNLYCLNEKFSTVLVYDANGKYQFEIRLPYSETGRNIIYTKSNCLCIVERDDDLDLIREDRVVVSIKNDLKNERMILIDELNNKIEFDVNPDIYSPVYYEKEILYITDYKKIYSYYNGKITPIRELEEDELEDYYPKSVTNKEGEQYSVSGIKPKLINNSQKMLVTESWWNWIISSDTFTWIFHIVLIVLLLLQTFLFNIVKK